MKSGADPDFSFRLSWGTCPKIHPVQVPWWPSNFSTEIKTKFKDFSGEIY